MSDAQKLQAEIALRHAKDQANQIYGSWFSVMRDWIAEPETVRHSGYKNLEEALVRAVAYVTREVEKIYIQYERENPG